MPERAYHRDALTRELRHSERGISVHLFDDFFQITKWELPDGVLQRADRLVAQNFIGFADNLKL